MGRKPVQSLWQESMTLIPAAGGVRFGDLNHSRAALPKGAVSLEYQAGTRALQQGTEGIRLPFRTVPLEITLAL